METRNFFLLQGRCKSSQSQMSELEKQVPLVPGVLSFAIGDPQRLLMKHCSSNPTKPAVISARSKTLSSKFATSGPPDLAAVYKFCRFMSSQLRRFSPIVYCIEPSIPAFSNSAFLLGSYLVLCHGFSPADAVQSLSRSDLPLVAFRQDAKGQLHGRVTLLDCLCALERASALGWFSPRSFDVERYERIADPQYGCIAEISPRLLTLRLPLGNVATVTVDNQMQLLRILGATCVAHIVARDGQADAAAAIAAAAGIAGLRYVALRCLANAEMRGQRPETTFAEQLISACVDEDRVAVLCPAVFSDGAGPSAALLAAWLAHCDGLPAGAAAAWIRIVCREPIAASRISLLKHCVMWEDVSPGRSSWHMAPSLATAHRLITAGCTKPARSFLSSDGGGGASKHMCYRPSEHSPRRSLSPAVADPVCSPAGQRLPEKGAQKLVTWRGRRGGLPTLHDSLDTATGAATPLASGKLQWPSHAGGSAGRAQLRSGSVRPWSGNSGGKDWDLPPAAPPSLRSTPSSPPTSPAETAPCTPPTVPVVTSRRCRRRALRLSAACNRLPLWLATVAGGGANGRQRGLQEGGPAGGL